MKYILFKCSESVLQSVGWVCSLTFFILKYKLLISTNDYVDGRAESMSMRWAEDSDESFPAAAKRKEKKREAAGNPWSQSSWPQHRRDKSIGFRIYHFGLNQCQCAELRIPMNLLHLLRKEKRRKEELRAIRKAKAPGRSIGGTNQLASEYITFSCNSWRRWPKNMENTPTCSSRSANWDGDEGFTL